MSRVLSMRETMAHRASPELQSLNLQDFAALTHRLSILGYYNNNNEAGTLLPGSSASILDAYNTFKAEIAGHVPEGPANIVPSGYLDRQNYVERAAKPYVPPGQETLDTSTLPAKIINDIARAAVADAGGNNIASDYGMTLREKLEDMVDKYQSGTLDNDGIAMLQATLRSKEHMLKIDGLDGPKTRAAVTDYIERKGAFFTVEERQGVSGWDNQTSGPDGSPLADDVNDFNGQTALPVQDDQALFVNMDAKDNPYLALDSEAGPLTKTQIKMMQGTLNIGGQDMDPQINIAINGAADSHTTEALKKFWEEKNLPTPPGLSFDELNSHHFEILRYWSLENRDMLVDRSRGIIDEQIEVGELKRNLQNYAYDDKVAGVQGTLSMLGHETAIDGLYGGQTAKNLMIEPDKYNRDPDMDYTRERPAPAIVTGISSP